MTLESMAAVIFFLTQINAIATVIAIGDEDKLAVILRRALRAIALHGPLASIWLASRNTWLAWVEGFEKQTVTKEGHLHCHC